MGKPQVLFFIGTRPEAIKLAPVLHAIDQREEVDAKVCLTGQHRELLDRLIGELGIQVDHDLNLMQPNQSLGDLTSRALDAMARVIAGGDYKGVIAQGDTTTVMVASLVAFYARLPFFHVEAGLRSHDLDKPWPEEFNRRVAGLAAALHFVPTAGARENLLAEGVPNDRIHLVGNTVIDTLLMMRNRMRQAKKSPASMKGIGKDATVVLITAHRRESFGDGFANLCDALGTLASLHPTVQFVYPVHPNPNVREPIHQALSRYDNLHLLPPLDYPEFVYLMNRSQIILTDSGGVQEEAPTLRKPVLVLRDVTERPEAVEAGTALLVGTDPQAIVEHTHRLLSDASARKAMMADSNPYGDGQAGERIAAALAAYLV